MKLVFAEARAPDQIYWGSPMSLLYAIAPLHRDLQEGLVAESTPGDLGLHQPGSLPGLLEVVARQRPRILGLSVTTYSIAFARNAARRCKQLDPDLQIVVGGPHFDGLHGHFDADPARLDEHVDSAFDVVISGEAEWALAALVRLAAAAPDVPLSRLVEGNAPSLANAGQRFTLWWRPEGGALRVLPSAPACGSEAGPRMIPPRQLLPAECEYHFSIFRDGAGRPLRTAQVLTYRGCLFAINPKNACTFCFVANTYQKASMAHTLGELRALKENGYAAIFFDDAVFTSPSRARKAELREIAAELRRLRFEAVGFQTRADYLDREVLEILSSAGCRWYCSLGLESTDPEILRLVGKKQSLDAVRSSLDLLRDFDVDVGLYLLFGALGDRAHGCRTPETPRTGERTIEFIAREVDRGVPVICTLPGVSMILPGTRDARSYQESAAQLERPLRFDICHEGAPWDRFEGGLGMHAPGVTAELLAHLSALGHRRLGSIWQGGVRG
jgi:hypothetical protein